MIPLLKYVDVDYEERLIAVSGESRSAN